MGAPWLIGVDLGQSRDPTALAILQRQVVTFGESLRQEYQARHLERLPLGMAYPKQVQAVGQRLQALPVPPGWNRDTQGPHYKLILDYTGVGRAVADVFRELSYWPVLVTFTAGQQVHSPARDEFTVPKVTLVSALQVALQTQRFKVARALPDADVLVKEALNFTFQPAKKPLDDEYVAWREGASDDLLFAVSLAVWYGERSAPLPPLHARQQKAIATGNPLARPPVAAGRVR